MRYWFPGLPNTRNFTLVPYIYIYMSRRHFKAPFVNCNFRPISLSLSLSTAPWKDNQSASSIHVSSLKSRLLNLWLSSFFVRRSSIYFLNPSVFFFLPSTGKRRTAPAFVHRFLFILAVDTLLHKFYHHLAGVLFLMMITWFLMYMDVWNKINQSIGC